MQENCCSFELKLNRETLPLTEANQEHGCTTVIRVLRTGYSAVFVQLFIISLPLSLLLLDMITAGRICVIIDNNEGSGIKWGYSEFIFLLFVGLLFSSTSYLFFLNGLNIIHTLCLKFQGSATNGQVLYSSHFQKKPPAFYILKENNLCKTF